MMLRLDAIDGYYGAVPALHSVSLTVAPGECLCLLGRNGAGKTTTLKAIMGLVPIRSGQISLGDERLDTLPAHEVPRRGIGYVPQGRRLFAELSVRENLEIGLMTRDQGATVRDSVLSLFPVLGDRLKQRAGTLSGGEQQMLAIARALCLSPGLLLLDEPTEGLQPSMVTLIRDAIIRLRSEGVAILLVEHKIEAVQAIANRVTFIENGETHETVPTFELPRHPDLLARYVGVGTTRK